METIPRPTSLAIGGGSALPRRMALIQSRCLVVFGPWSGAVVPMTASLASVSVSSALRWKYVRHIMIIIQLVKPDEEVHVHERQGRTKGALPRDHPRIGGATCPRAWDLGRERGRRDEGGWDDGRWLLRPLLVQRGSHRR